MIFIAVPSPQASGVTGKTSDHRHPASMTARPYAARCTGANGFFGNSRQPPAAVAAPETLFLKQKTNPKQRPAQQQQQGENDPPGR
jgi:hypothetical protein